MRDVVHPSRMMIIRTVLYKDRFDLYVRNTGNITARIVLKRPYVSGQDRRIHASLLCGEVYLKLVTIFHFRSIRTLVFPLLVTSVMSIIRYSTVISAKCFLLHNNYCFCWYFLCIFISVTSYDAEQRINCIEQEKNEEHTSLLSLAVVLSPFPSKLTQRLQLYTLSP
jgi:hypothetical protein